MIPIWGFFGGPTNGLSIRYLSCEIGSYSTVSYLIKNITRIIHSLDTVKLSGPGEHDKMLPKAVYKETKIDGTDGRHTTPSRRAIPRGPGRDIYEKDTPMVTIAYRRPDKTEREHIVHVVSTGVKKLADTVAATFEPGSCICTDDYNSYNFLEKTGYDHHTVNHSEGEYASGKNTTDNRECLAGPLKWWLKKRRDISKQNLNLYAKSYEFMRNRRHCNDAGRLLAALSVALGTYQGREAYNDSNVHLAEIVQKLM